MQVVISPTSSFPSLSPLAAQWQPLPAPPHSLPLSLLPLSAIPIGVVVAGAQIHTDLDFWQASI